jgi:hypothetical protein
VVSDPTLSIRVEGDRVRVESGTDRREFHNVLVLVPGPKGSKQIIAVGEPLESLRQSSEARSAEGARVLAGAEEKTALDLQGFRPELAAAFINYLVMTHAPGASSWFVRRKLRVSLEMAGYEAVAEELRREFEDAVRRLWGQVLVNGVTARGPTRPWWYVPALLGALAPVPLAVRLGPRLDTGLRSLLVPSALLVSLLATSIVTRRRSTR